MRFPKSFKRYVGGGGTALGSDGSAGTPPTHGPVATMDNVLATKISSNDGWPVHRVAVAYKGPGGAPTLPAQIWVYDAETESWYEVGAPVNLTRNRLTYLDLPALADPIGQPGGASSGGVVMALVVLDNSAPSGEYTFAFGADLTVLPV